MADGVMDRIETINNIPLCDREARDLLESKANIDHTHDNYATKTELNMKANVTHTHSNYALKSDLTDILNRLTTLENKYTEILTRLNNIETRLDDLESGLEDGPIVEPSVMYTITYVTTEGITLSDNSTSINAGNRYVNTITYADGYVYDSIQIIMGGVDITNSITIHAPGPNQQGFAIESVTGDLVIRIEAIKEIEVAIYNITYNLGTGISLNHQLSEVGQGASMEWTITCSNGYELDSGKCYITMGGVDVSSNVFHYDGNNDIVSIGIENITGNININLASKLTEEVSPAVMYDISYYLVGSVSSDDQQQIQHGESFYTTITVTESTLIFSSIQVTMGDETMGNVDITNSCCTMNDKEIIVNVPSVTGDLHIDARTIKNGYSITYNDNGNVTYSNKQLAAAEQSSFGTYIYFTTSLDDFLSIFKVTISTIDMTESVITQTSNDCIYIYIPQVTGPVVIYARY